MEAKNVGSLEIPSFGLVMISQADWENPDRTVLHVKRPTAYNARPLAINSFKPIPAGDYGLVTIDGPAWVKYKTGETPSNNEEYGAALD
jgi:hypothetical protein